MSCMYYKIDWKKERDALTPHMNGKGGIIRVEYRGDECAPNNFNAMLKQWHAEVGAPSFSIRIDPDYFTTRTLEDILDEFDKKLAVAGYPTAPVDAARTTILSENRVGGNATFHMENVFINGGFDGAKIRSKRVSAVLAALVDFLKKGRCMVVAQHHSPADQNFFWRHFWQGGLDTLVAHGLLLVHFHDKNADDRLHTDAPAPDLTLTLPRDLSSDDRDEQAYDDLYDVFKEKGLSNDGASEAASTLLLLSKLSVAAVHDNFAIKLMSMTSK
jgi:hypothetical protein